MPNSIYSQPAKTKTPQDRFKSWEKKIRCLIIINVIQQLFAKWRVKRLTWNIDHLPLHGKVLFDFNSILNLVKYRFRIWWNIDFLLQIGWLVRGDREMPAAYWGESFRSGLLSEPPNISAPQTEIFESYQTTDLKLGLWKRFLACKTHPITAGMPYIHSLVHISIIPWSSDKHVVS